MAPAGIASFERRSEHKSKIYTCEKAEVRLSAEFEKIFSNYKRDWNFFQELAPSYRKPATNWVMSAKRKATRINRLN